MSSSSHIANEDIPEGFQIYEKRLSPAGLSFRKDDAISFVRSSDGWLELEHEPSNNHDKNAIKVIGCNKGLFWTKRRFVGYLPKEVSKNIIDNGFLALVRARLIKTYVGNDGYIEIIFQLLGPEGRKKEYKNS